jgi:hypothetical protein
LKTVALLALVICLLAVWTACGSSTTNNGTVGITISPTTAVLPVSTSQQFYAAVSNSSNTGITWQVNGTTGGSSTYGTISTSGVYTAPSSVPSSTVTVTAVAQADTTKTASATVTISSANTLVISPTSATVAAGAQQGFSATLGGTAVTTNWSVSCGDSTSGACGSIDSNGMYTAPLTPPLGQTVTVFAKSPTNVATAANANVTVTYGMGTLNGPYAFLLRGYGSSANYTAVGSIIFDGKGNITGGSVDLPGDLSTPVAITGGTYTCSAEGSVQAVVVTASGSQGWQITLVNHSRALVTRTDIGTVVARGELDLQDSTQFGSNLVGSLAIHLRGNSSRTLPVAGEVGALYIDASGNVTTGELDVNDGGTVSTDLTASGSAVTSSSTTGRGTLTLASTYGSQTFAYYRTGTYTATLIETDGSHDYAGKLVWRTPDTAITAQYFLGSYGFVLPGANSSGLLAQGGTFSVSSSGGISNGTLDTSTDTTYALGYLFSGTLAVADATTGRSLVTVTSGTNTLHYVVYPPDADGNLTLLGIDTSSVAIGPAMSSDSVVTGTSIPAVSGHFAAQMGELTSSTTKTESGGLVLSTVAPTGWLDILSGSNITLGTTVTNSSFSISSLYGRGSLFLQTGSSYSATYGAYLVNGYTVLLMQTDGSGLQTGALQKRY